MRGWEGPKKLVMTLGRYYFDKNPFIGTLADINVWDRSDLSYPSQSDSLVQDDV